jgi:N-omega-hydroxy-L-arginine synthase
MTLRYQAEIESAEAKGMKGWQRETARALLARLRPPSGFPCFFSQAACRRGRILFAFAEGLDAASLDAGARDLLAYLARARAWDGDVATAEPLVMLFNPANVHGETVEDYHRFGWQVLQHWHDNDRAAWPEGVSLDPHSPYWAMCFDGMQLFVNMSSPAHRIRQSRNLGPALTLVINPRERFDVVAGDNPQGRLIRERIRTRIEDYDGQPHSPMLGSYEAGEIEWWQYGLKDTNEPTASGCPFRTRARETAD